jgi:ABC-type phosphate transport system substrate-binding protein
MMLFVIQIARLTTRTVLAVALTVACLNAGIAQAQELTAGQPSAAENDSAAEASKQAANPLASVWLMQFQQNNTWFGMPSNRGNRVQSNLSTASRSPVVAVPCVLTRNTPNTKDKADEEDANNFECR